MKQLLVFAVAVGVTASFGLRAQDDAPGSAMPDSEPMQEGDAVDGAAGMDMEDDGSGGVRITYEPGKGITFAHPDVAELNISGTVQAKLYFADNEMQSAGNPNVIVDSGNALSFSLRRARTNFEGYVFSRDIRYRVQLDHSSPSTVLDAWGDWHFYNAEDGHIGVRLGQQKMRGSLQFDTEGTGLEFTERSLATRTFSELRDLGMLMHGAFLNGKKDGTYKMHWHLGAMNSGTASGAASAAALNDPLTGLPNPDSPALVPSNRNVSDELTYTAGVFFSPDGVSSTEDWTEGDLNHGNEFESLFGAQILLGNEDYGSAYSTMSGGTVSTTQIALSGAAKSGTGFALQGEVFLRNDDSRRQNGAGNTVLLDADSTGYYVQGSYTTAGGEGKTQYGFAARYSWVDLETGSALAAVPSTFGTAGLAAAGEISEVQLGVNAYYHKHHLKTQLVASLQNVDPSVGADFDSYGFDLMFTLMF